MTSFSESIKINCTVMLKETQANCYIIMDDLFNSVVNLTPVGATAMEIHPGLLKNNWFSAVGESPSTDTTDVDDPAGSDSKLNISVLKEYNLFDGKDSTVTFANNLDYAILAERDGWPKPKWSGASPYRMVANSVSLISGKYPGVG